MAHDRVPEPFHITGHRGSISEYKGFAAATVFHGLEGL
jgi:hypothetical protein